ncbi:MAG: hypothetical protein B6I28_02165 [Fusobacteriia bacterium 4572_132]|nr:MAG: hypothetical protein B6I28_02165 [Fusobacteriia bacterium 4572_132]
MKKYFFLGIGVGLILSGIIQNLSLKKEMKVDKILEKKENISKKEIDIFGKENIIKKNIDILESETKFKRKLEVLKEKKTNDEKQIMQKEKKLFLIQLGAYRKLENANLLKEKVKKIPLKIIKSGDIYKVVSKQYLKKEKAMECLEIIKNEYNIKAYIKQNDGRN